jgi:outer membrane cobalamin receptor
MKLRLRQAIALPLLLAFLCVISPVALSVQEKGTLTGVITDPSGGAIAGATISATSSGASASTPAIQTVSGADGRYSVTLPPGKYNVRVTQRSFENAEREISIAGDQNIGWNMRLGLAVLSTSVVVAAGAEPVQTEYVTSPVNFLTAQDVEQRQEIWLAPMLASTPGAALSRLGALGGITTFFLDGGNSNYTKVLLDGTPINEPGGDVEFSNMTTDDIEKVEIVHGASSALFGTDALDGVIQIFTDRGSTRIPILELTADGGNMSTMNGSAKLSGLLGAFDYSNYGSYFDSNGEGANDRFRNTTLGGNYGYKFSATDTLRLSVRSISSDAGQPGQTALEPAFLTQSADQRNFFGNLAWDFALSDHWQQHFAGTEAYIRQLFVESPFANVFDEYNNAGFEEQTSYLYRQSAVSLGYQYLVENGIPDGPHVRRNNQGGYIDTRNQLSRRWTVTAGARAEDNASFGTRVVPRAGVSYAPHFGNQDAFWGATRLHGSYGQGIKEPTFEQSFEDDPCDPGNPNLAPERSTTYDVGVEQVLADNRIRVNVDYFHNLFYDIVSFSGGPPTSACPFGTGAFFNTDKARAYGANTSLEARPLRWLSILAQYSYDDTRVLEAPNAFDPTLAPGNRLFLRPLNSAQLIINAAIRRMNWNLAGYFVGRTTDSDFLGLGYTYNPGYVRWDLATSLPIHHNLTAIGRVENLFDRHYQYAVGYPALGTTFRAGLKYVWGGGE